MQNEISNKSPKYRNWECDSGFFDVSRRAKENKQKQQQQQQHKCYSDIQLNRYQQRTKMFQIIKRTAEISTTCTKIPVALNDDFWFESEANGSVLVSESR